MKKLHSLNVKSAIEHYRRNMRKLIDIVKNAEKIWEW